MSQTTGLEAITTESAEEDDSILAELGEPPRTCGLCETILDASDVVAEHSCLQPYPRFVYDENYYFYPVCADGSVVQKTLIDGEEQIVCVAPGGESDSNNENIDTNNVQDGQNRSSINDEDFKERLIDYVHQRAALWNFKDVPSSKRGTYAKDALWKEISALFLENPEIVWLKKQWKNLCTIYSRNKKAMEGKSGQAAKMEPKWCYFNMMTFLDDVDLTAQETTSNISRPLSNTFPRTTVQCADESLGSLRNFQNLPALDEVLGDDLENNNSSYQNHPKPTKQKKNANAQIAAAETLARAIESSTPVINFPSIPALPPPPPPTEATAFGHLIEVKLQKIEDQEDLEEVTENVLNFLNSEIKRIRRKRKQ